MAYRSAHPDDIPVLRAEDIGITPWGRPKPRNWKQSMRKLRWFGRRRRASSDR